MNARTITTLAGLASITSLAMANPTLYMTSGHQMYRIDLGLEPDIEGGEVGGPQVSVFQMDRLIVSLTSGDNGELWGTERYDSNENGFHALYRFDDINTTPVMTMQGDFLVDYNSTMTNVSGTLHAFNDASRELLALDHENDTFSVVGSYADLPFTPASSGYDAQTDALYGLKIDELYRFNINPTTESSLTTQKIADLDFGGIIGASGGEIIDGVYYHGIVDANMVMHLFTIDLLTGATEEILAFEVSESGAFGLAGFDAPVPTPGTMALLALGGFFSVRRRR